MLFTSLPLQILGLILEYPSSSYLIIRLWKCGDHVLNLKLAMSISTVILRHHPNLPSLWPAMLSQLPNLRHLSITSNSDLMNDSSDWIPALQALPKTLEVLEIDSTDSSIAFNNYGDSEEPIITENAIGSTPFVDIGALFPYLRELSIVGADHFDLLPVLPPNLTRYCTSSVIKCGSRSVMSTLPRTLERLEATVIVHFGLAEEDILFEDWSRAPPNLVHIDKLRWLECPSSAKWIPKSLTSGRIGFSLANDQASPLCAKELASLPPLASQLGLELCPPPCPESTHTDATWFSQLPKGLKVFRMIPSDYITPDIIQSLPSSLTKLVLSEISQDAWNRFSPLNWPAGLEELSITDNIGIGTLSILPRHLKSLDVNLRLIGPLEHLSVSELPPKLQSLRLSANLPATLERPIIGELPSSLTLMDLFHIGDGRLVLNQLRFPDSLISLSYTSLEPSCVFEQLQLWELPSSLTKLEIECFRIDWFHAVPPSVTHLSISSLCSDPELIPSTGIDLFADLTTSVLVLEIDHNSPHPDRLLELSNNAFSRHINLEIVHAAQALLMPSRAIRSLPKKLKELDVPVKCLEVDDLPFIPMNLSVCFTGTGIDWELPDLAEYWPVKAMQSLPESDLDSAFYDRIFERQSEYCH